MAIKPKTFIVNIEYKKTKNSTNLLYDFQLLDGKDMLTALKDGQETLNFAYKYYTIISCFEVKPKK